MLIFNLILNVLLIINTKYIHKTKEFIDNNVRKLLNRNTTKNTSKEKSKLYKQKNHL